MTAGSDQVDGTRRWLRGLEVFAGPLPELDPELDPDARVLILKGVDASGRQFAGHASSPQGGRLTCHPRAALTFSWPEHGRQVRIRGR
ncbi:pyridoxamine 5'-phosphate oxidase family protein [Streptomyces nojiriensis]|uniref:pyridoxamine 5'-phosphate oxidase family protein n=1 Tax=Streptomyces nojiriensis TaxID=66374 RepID=UPI00367A088B